MKTYGELMEAVAAVRSPTRRTVKPTATADPYPWWRRHTGWWHTSGKYMTFIFKMESNFHITQVFRDPSFFGLTKKKILSYIEEDRGVERWGAELEYRAYLLGKEDKYFSMEQDLLMNRGWVRVRGDTTTAPFLMLEGFRDSIRKAVGIASLHARDGYIIHAQERKTSEDVTKSVTMNTLEKMERYHRGR